MRAWQIPNSALLDWFLLITAQTLAPAVTLSSTALFPLCAWWGAEGHLLFGKQARLGSVQDLGQVGRQGLCHFKRKHEHLGWKMATVPGSAVLDVSFHSALCPPRGDSAHFGCCHVWKYSIETSNELQRTGLAFALWAVMNQRNINYQTPLWLAS